MFYKTLITALLHGCWQVLSLLLKLKTYIKDHLDSCLAITQVPTKKIWEKSGEFSMHVKRKHKLCIEIYKTLNNSNPSFMKSIFGLWFCSRPVREQSKLNLNIPRKRQVTFGTKSLESLGPENWNNLHIRSAENLKNGMVPPVVAMCVPYKYFIP